MPTVTVTETTMAKGSGIEISMEKETVVAIPHEKPLHQLQQHCGQESVCHHTVGTGSCASERLSGLSEKFL
jgi:hypothetical protein